MSGRSPSPAPGLGASVVIFSIFIGSRGQLAYLCLSQLSCNVLVSFLRVKARRKQAAKRPGDMDDEDPVMGTVTWVSDMGVFSCKGRGAT